MQDTGSILNIQEITYTFLVKICLIFYSIYICIDIALSKTVADDLLQCEKIEKRCLLKLTGRKAFVNGSHCSKFYYGSSGSRKKWSLIKRWHRVIQKLISLEKNMIEHNFKRI